MTDLSDFGAIAAQDNGLVVVSTLRADGTMQASVVNAGIYEHPITGERGVAFIAMGRARKLANLRVRPRVTVVAQASWQWAAVEGNAALIGPDDPIAGIDTEQLRLELRAVFVAAGGTHDNWDEYDRVMKDESRTIAFVSVERVYSN